MIRISSYFVATLFAASAHAQIYKCIESTGEIVYLQTPCPAGDQSRVISSRLPPATAEPAAQSTAEQEFAFRKRQKEREEAQKKASANEQVTKEKEENCSRARAQLAQLEMGGRISSVTADGERYYLDDERIAQEKSKAKVLVDEWCK